MKVLVCLDSFKGSLTSLQAGNAVKQGLLNANNNLNVEVVPISDGGEGFLECMQNCLVGKIVTAVVSGPLGDKMSCEYYITNNTAIIEVSKCIGLPLVKNKNPLYTTTYGVGELILDAINNNCKNFIIGIGGSSTNDGGVGMLQALGYKFLDENNNQIKLGAIGLKDLVKIENTSLNLKDLSFKIATDVTNPLTGKNGASYVYAGQKGATKQDIKLMDSWLNNYAKLTKKLLPLSNKKASGTGASGGLGFAFKEFLNAKLLSGIELVANNTLLKDKIKSSDLVIVGEGKLDRQSLMGKAPCYISNLASEQGKKVIAFAGVLDITKKDLVKSKIEKAYCIVPQNQSLLEAIKPENAIKNLTCTAEQVFKHNYNF